MLSYFFLTCGRFPALPIARLLSCVSFFFDAGPLALVCLLLSVSLCDCPAVCCWHGTCFVLCPVVSSAVPRRGTCCRSSYCEIVDPAQSSGAVFSPVAHFRGVPVACGHSRRRRRLRRVRASGPLFCGREKIPGGNFSLLEKIFSRALEKQYAVKNFFYGPNRFLPGGGTNC